MTFNLPRLGRLQRKVLLAASTIVLLPMLAAGWFASEWVSTNFENRLEQWVTEAARANLNWLQAYQNDAVMLGRVLSDDPVYRQRLNEQPEEAIPQSVRRIAQELGINLVQVYTPDLRLVYSSLPIEMGTLWEPGQTEAVLKVTRRNRSMIAAIGITPVPRQGAPRYYLVLGSVLGQDFTKELEQLTGMQTRLYLRQGKRYLDFFSADGGAARPLPALPAEALERLEKGKKPWYGTHAEDGQYRGVYTPIVDSSGHVEAIMFSGLERRGVQEFLTNRLTMFLSITLIGLVLGALTGLLLSRLVLRPLGYLRDGVLQLGGQNFNASVPIDTDDELGDLAKAFNAMAARLREARDEQARRFQRDKLAALGELSASLAHEIRNPLGVINASAALLDRPDQDEARRAQLARMIREESQRVSNLVQDFLHLSRPRQPALAAIDPAAPLERALELALAGRAPVKVTKKFRHGGARIQGDVALLQQAWGNILGNALQAMDGREPELLLESLVENGAVWLAVEDNGPGIAVEIMPRLFEPFFTTKDQGTGLGLSIAHALVEANGGRLEAVPPVGKGARFRMRFPLIEETQR
ncbi:MAG: ATP-binding protein [Pseudomonadota bacterium]